MYTEVANQGWLYVVVAVILAVVLAQTLAFMKKAWGRSLELGVTRAQAKKGITIGFGVSIMPTVAVLVVLFTLIPLLGGPLAWFRLSVIGSATFETMASQWAVTGMGEEFIVGGFSISAWVAAAWVCTIAGITNIIWMAIACKPCDVAFNKMTGKVDMKWIGILGTCAIMGIMGYLSVTETKNGNKRLIFLISFVCSFLISLLIKKVPKLKKLKDWNLSISLIVGMLAACLIYHP